jgi:predicted lipid carrier protein YhbT
MKTDATAEFFAEVARRAHEPLLKKATGTLRLELRDGKRKHYWRVSIDGGGVAVSRSRAAASATVRTDKSLFDRLVRGEANAMAAYLRGALIAEGDLELLVYFQRLFPGPPLLRGKR